MYFSRCNFSVVINLIVTSFCALSSMIVAILIRKGRDDTCKVVSTSVFSK